MSNTDATMLSGRPRPIRGFSKARRFKKSSGQLRVSLSWTGTSGLACHLRVIPLTDGDVGHYDIEPGESNPLDVIDRLCYAEGLNILPSSREFSKGYF